MLEEYVAVFKAEFSHGMEQQDGCLENICSTFSVMAIGGIKLGLESEMEYWDTWNTATHLREILRVRRELMQNFEVVLDMLNV